MSAVMIGDPGVVHFQGFRWWAERGLLHSENSSTGEYQTQTVRTTLERLKALNDMKDIRQRYDETELQSYIDQMVELCKKAQFQGRPEDPRVSKGKAEEYKRQHRTTCTPGLRGTF